MKLFKLLGTPLFTERGSNRDVYVYSNFVVKIPRNADGIAENENEIELWKYTEGMKSRDYLFKCEPMVVGSTIAVKMSRATVAGFEPRTKIYMKDVFFRDGIEAADLAARNIGLDRFGNIRVLDYGDFRKMV